MSSLPCLIFTEDLVLCGEQDALASVRNVFDMPQLKHAFFTSLGGNLRAFRSFCGNGETGTVSGYRIYSLKEFGPFRYAFCEKNTVCGAVITTVFLSADQSTFYRLLAPSSVHFRSLHDRLAYELFYIKNNNILDVTSLSPDAFLVVSRVPHLVESLFSSELTDSHCNIADFINATVAAIGNTHPLGSTKINFYEKYLSDEAPSIIKLSAVPFAFLLYLTLSLASSLSAEHDIDVNLSSFGDSAEIEVSTASNRFAESIPIADITVLEDALPSMSSHIKISSIIADLAGIDIKASYDSVSGVFSIQLGINYDPSPIPDFKFSDPTESIADALNEAISFLSEK